VPMVSGSNRSDIKGVLLVSSFHENGLAYWALVAAMRTSELRGGVVARRTTKSVTAR
jgi:hypothetical protein